MSGQVQNVADHSGDLFPSGEFYRFRYGIGLAPRRWGCGGGVKPSRVGQDGPTHPPLKQNGHHCDIHYRREILKQLFLQTCVEVKQL